MVKVTQGVSKTDSLRQSARHVLFVEGETAQGFDVPVLSALLRNHIQVTPLGPSFCVKSAAEALFPHHPDYYFLVDRDHQDEKAVAQSWRRFPDPATNNLLIWRRRELESYFLISSYMTLIGDTRGADIRRLKSKDEIEMRILKACERRLFIDSANQVIAEIREQNKTKWIEFFQKPGELPNRDIASDKLINHPAFAEKRALLKQQTDRRKLKARFETIIQEMTGGGERLELGKGNWLEKIRAKKIFAEISNSCFKVLDRNRKEIRGPEKNKQIALALAREPLEKQPEDFQTLYSLIESRVGGSQHHADARQSTS